MCLPVDLTPVEEAKAIQREEAEKGTGDKD